MKLGGSVLVAGILLALFLYTSSERPTAIPPVTDPAERLATIARLDHGIDSVLALFGVASAGVKKQSYEIPGEGLTRTERLVSIPDTIVPVSVNAALNDLARRFNARAVASENLRLRLVTVHLELDGRIVHTVILRKAPRNSAHGGRRPAT